MPRYEDDVQQDDDSSATRTDRLLGELFEIIRECEISSDDVDWYEHALTMLALAVDIRERLGPDDVEGDVDMFIAELDAAQYRLLKLE